MSPKHDLKKVLFKDKWFKYMKRFKIEIEFFKWFESTGQIGECNSSLQVLVNRLHTKDKVVESITPPLEGISILYRRDVLKATPFNNLQNIRKITLLLLKK